MAFWNKVGKVIGGTSDILLKGTAKTAYNTFGTAYEVAALGEEAVRKVGGGVFKAATKEINPEDINDFGELLIGRRLKKSVSLGATAAIAGIAVTSSLESKDRREAVGQVIGAEDSHSMINPTTRANKQYTEEEVRKVMNNGAEGDIVFALHNQR